MNLLERSYNWLHIKKYAYPSQKAIETAIRHLIAAPPLYSSNPVNRLKNRKYQVAFQYGICKVPIEEIAQSHNVTRERVRQILHRIYNDYLNMITVKKYLTY